MYNHMGREDTFIYPILLDMFSDPGKGLELLAKQETFIKQGIGIDYLTRSYYYAGHPQRTTLGQAIGRQIMVMARDSLPPPSHSPYLSPLLPPSFTPLLLPPSTPIYRTHQ